MGAEESAGDAQSSSSSDSCASDSNERFKNVRALLVAGGHAGLQAQPPDENYAYKRKLGDLVFDAHFETGNLGRVERVDQFHYDLCARPDLASARHRMWFNFRVANQRPGQCVVLTLVNLSEDLTRPLALGGLAPVVRSRRAPDWRRLPSGQVFYYRSPDHANRRVLSLAFRFRGGGGGGGAAASTSAAREQPGGDEDDEHQFALFYPYGITTLSSFLARWSVELARQQRKRAQGGVARLQVDLLARSALNHPIYELRIAQAEADAHEAAPAAQLAVFLAARPTSGNFESASSLVAQGFLDFLLGAGPLQACARRRLATTVWPLLDPDATWAGNARTDLLGQRASLLSARFQAEVVAPNERLYAPWRRAHARLLAAASRAAGRLVVLELRVDASLVGARLVGTRFSDSLRMERHLHLARLLARFSSAFYLEKCRFLEPADAPGAQLVALNPQLDAYRLELSPLGFHRRSLASSAIEPFNQQQYLLLGKALACALLELTRPKPGELPVQVERLLGAFRASSRDIDDLALVEAAAHQDEAGALAPAAASAAIQSICD